MDDLKRKLKFLRLIERFKTIERFNQTSKQNRPESDAEHTWHLTMIVYLLAEDYPGVNRNHCIELALVHDLVELISGDINVWDNPSRVKKSEKEKIAAKKLFSELPDRWKIKFYNLWIEYKDRKTREARLVYALDKIQPHLQRAVAKDNGLIKKRINLKNLIKLKPKEVKENKLLNEMWDGLIKEIAEKKLVWFSSG